MSTIIVLRDFVNQRLTAAVEEIFRLLETTIANYESEIDRQRKLLEDAVNHENNTNKADAEKQQEWSFSLDQEEPQPADVKEELEELCSSQVGEQLQSLEEADITSFPFTHVLVKSENNDEEAQSSQSGSEEEEAQSSQLHQNQTEENRDAEPRASSSRNLHPADYSQPVTDESETDHSDDDGKETRKLHSGLKAQRNHQFLLSTMGTNADKNPFSCSECHRTFGRKGNLKRHMTCHTDERPYSCSVCDQRFVHKSTMISHVRIHTGEKPFTCSVCGKSFRQSSILNAHVRIHTGEKPFTCSVCNVSFTHRATVFHHMKIHTGKKPFACPVCFRPFMLKGHLVKHMSRHRGEDV